MVSVYILTFLYVVSLGEVIIRLIKKRKNSRSEKTEITQVWYTKQQIYNNILCIYGKSTIYQSQRDYRQVVGTHTLVVVAFLCDRSLDTRNRWKVYKKIRILFLWCKKSSHNEGVFHVRYSINIRCVIWLTY